MAVQDSTQRFSSRVGNYVRYRPGYPSAVLDLLKNECGLTPASVIADIASGTGIFTRMLLENGNRVFGVEPNAEMRQGRGGISARLFSASPVWRERPKPRRWPITASILSPRPRRPTGLIARRRAANSFASAGPAAGRCCSGTSGAPDQRHFCVTTSSCCWQYGTDYQEVRSRAHHGADRDVFRALAISVAHF